MKHTGVTKWLLIALCCLVFASPAVAAVGEAKFGTGISQDKKLLNEGREFDTNRITCAFYGTKPFGVMQLVVSIYHRAKPADSEAVLARVKVNVNPKWGILFLPDLPLPRVGQYTFTLATPDEEVLASGPVTITDKKVEEVMPEQPKIDGATVEGLFKKFQPNM